MATSRDEILDTAKRLITVDREQEHGRPGLTFARTAHLWAGYLGHEVTAHDVAAMMALLKIARSTHDPDNMDNWIDACGYLALGAELTMVTGGTR